MKELVVPRLSVQNKSTFFVPVSQLRTGSLSDQNGVKLEELPEGQTIVGNESEERNEIVNKINSQLDTDPGRMFAVVHVRGHQHKVTQGDLLMIRTDLGAPIGAKIVLQKLLALGARDFTLLGRPVLPLDLAQVEATVIEKSLARTKVHQYFKRRERCRKFRYNR